MVLVLQHSIENRSKNHIPGGLGSYYGLLRLKILIGLFNLISIGCLLFLLLNHSAMTTTVKFFIWSLLLIP